MKPEELRSALVKLYGEGSDYHLAKMAVADLGVSRSTLLRRLAGQDADVKVPIEVVLKLKGAA